MKNFKYWILALALLLLAPVVTHAQSQANGGGTVPMACTTCTATTVNSQDVSNSNWKGGHVIFNVSAYISGTYTPHIQGKDPASGTYYDVLVGTGSNVISSAGTTVLKVYPGIAAIAGGAASDIVPSTWRVQLIGASTPSMTLTVGWAFDN